MKSMNDVGELVWAIVVALAVIGSLMILLMAIIRRIQKLVRGRRIFRFYLNESKRTNSRRKKKYFDPKVFLSSRFMETLKDMYEMDLFNGSIFVTRTRPIAIFQMSYMEMIIAIVDEKKKEIAIKHYLLDCNLEKKYKTSVFIATPNGKNAVNIINPKDHTKSFFYDLSSLNETRGAEIFKGGFANLMVTNIVNGPSRLYFLEEPSSCKILKNDYSVIFAENVAVILIEALILFALIVFFYHLGFHTFLLKLLVSINLLIFPKSF